MTPDPAAAADRSAAAVFFPVVEGVPMRRLDRRSTLSWLAALALLPACKIVRDKDKKKPGVANGGFDADAYVNGIWDAKVLPLVREHAVEITNVLDALAKDVDAAGQQYGHRAEAEGAAWNFIVKGQGKVTKADVASRHGTLVVALDRDPAGRSVTLQVGPVVFGSAFRDSLPFVSFNDFVNQIDYAQVSRKLNDRAVAAARANFDPAKAEGRTVAFQGAMVNPAGGEIQVTPVILEAQ
jgi:predicted lipoprotein